MLPRVLWVAMHHKNPPPSYFWQIQNVNLLVNNHSVVVWLSQPGQGNCCSFSHFPGGGSVQSRADIAVWWWKHSWSVEWLWFCGFELQHISNTSDVLQAWSTTGTPPLETSNLGSTLTWGQCTCNTRETWFSPTLAESTVACTTASYSTQVELHCLCTNSGWSRSPEAVMSTVAEVPKGPGEMLGLQQRGRLAFQMGTLLELS